MNEFLKTAGATAVTGAVLLAIWYALTLPGRVPPEILPPPVDVLKAFYFAISSGYLWPHIVYTVKVAVIGLLLGTLAAALMAGVVVLFPVIGAFFTPVAVATQSIPKIAIAPIFIAYMGFGVEAKVITVIIVCFLPMFLGTLAGLQSLDSRLVDLYRAASASRFHVLIHARIPAAAPFFFSSLQVTVALALVGAVVAEFIASSQGLGYVLKSRAEDVNLSIMFATIGVLSVIGFLGGASVRALARRIVHWK